MQISVILPAYNSADFIAASIRSLTNDLRDHYGDQFEVIVVDDGSTDTTREELSAFSTDPNVIVVGNQTNQGKNAAIKSGMRLASGTCKIFTDADLPYDLASLHQIIALVNEGAHMAVGDRTLSDSTIAAPISPVRSFASRTLGSLSRIYLRIQCADPQCGLKGFRKDVAKHLFDLTRDERFGADLELHFLAEKYGLTIKRSAVRLVHHGKTTVRPTAVAVALIHRIIRIRIDWMLGRYHSEALTRINP